MVSNSSSLIESFYIIGFILICVIGGYAAYWSFAILRALRVPLYRRQLLWVGSTCLYGIILLFSYYFGSAGTTTGFIPTALATYPDFSTFSRVFFILLPVVLYVWADSSVRVARRSDPLLRDPFRWNRTRTLLWATSALGLALISVTGLTPPYPVLTDYNINAIPGYAVGFVLQYLVLAVAAVALLIGGRRSGDVNFRRSLEWYSVCLAVLVIGTIGSFIFVTGNILADTPVNFAWGVIENFIIWPLEFFSIYRCARSLVPMNKLRQSE